jgi:hypothetical protein
LDASCDCDAANILSRVLAAQLAAHKHRWRKLHHKTGGGSTRNSTVFMAPAAAKKEKKEEKR